MPGFSRAAVLAALLLAGDGGSQYAVYAASDAARDEAGDVVGTYRRVGPAIVVMTVAAQAEVEVRLEGGGPPSLGEAAPADCVVRAIGLLHERTLRAVFEPIETEDFSYDAAQARTEDRRLVVAFAPQTAKVEEADTEGYCGLGIEFRGLYRKTR
jgi:hypothetical protein